MSDNWNLFLDSAQLDSLPPRHWRLPQRVYARIEAVESDAKSKPLWIRLDGVDADWFEATLNEQTDVRAYFQSMPLVAIEFDPNVLSMVSTISPLLDLSGNEFDDIATDDPNLWLELEFGPSGFECEVYWNLTAAPVPAMARARVARPPAVAALRKTYDLDRHFSPASAAAIQQELSRVGSVDGVVVYDVGQGSAAGLVDHQCRPLLYADIGGGVTRNRHTFPAALTHFCTCTKAPIVLSHWDWDHWASAGRGQNKSLRTHTWIAPMQKAVGPSHLSFAQAIQSKGKLLLWARGTQSPITSGSLTLERCTAAGRNHSGIALIVDGPVGKNPILFPGDARYGAIPSGLGAYDSVVVPHHGADMNYRSTPASPGAGHSRAIYSYGPGNTFTGGTGTVSHPAWITRTDHDSRGWSDSKVSAVLPWQVRQTEDRSALSNLGHVYGTWTSVSVTPLLACGGSPTCDLEPTQH